MSDLLSNHKQRLTLESSLTKLETNPLYQTLDSTGGTQFSAVQFVESLPQSTTVLLGTTPGVPDYTVKTRVLIYTPKVCFKTHHGV